MNYFIDTEFVEDGSTIMPISLALVSEDCRELYLELDFDEAKAEAHDFVRENVLPHLRLANRSSKQEAREVILEFLGEDPDPMFWAYYADYDWVLLCQLFGTMIDLPDPLPKHCMDLQQWWVQLGRPGGVKPAKPKNAHDALADARWNYVFYQNLKAFDTYVILELDRTENEGGTDAHHLQGETTSLKVIVKYRSDQPDNDEQRAAWLKPGHVRELPDDTEAFLRRVQPLGRFSIDLSTNPLTLFFENDYD